MGISINRPGVVSDAAIKQLVQNDEMILRNTWYPGDQKVSLQTANHGEWLLCDGATYQQELSPQLYELLSGAGGTFTVPTTANTFIHI